MQIQSSGNSSQKQSKSNWQSQSPKRFTKNTQRGKLIAPEDDWELTGNPDVYLDQLPQPYRFINNCLEQLILKKVDGQIKLIEEKTKTPEYEGDLRELQATGFMEIDGISTMCQTSIPIGGGGQIEKDGMHSIQNKVLIGDKFGQIHLFDVSRKLVLDKKIVFEGNRRIRHISTSTVVWMDTKLTYASVIARGSPFVKILIFKHNENKLVHIYNLNTCPTLPNPDNLEANPDQSYLDLPCEVKLSVDNVFMAITSFSGDIKLIKMPHIINPLRDESETQQQQQQTLPLPGQKGAPAQQPALQLSHIASTQGIEDKMTLKSEIDQIQVSNLDFNQVFISKIEAKKDQKFVDPFIIKPQVDPSQPPQANSALQDIQPNPFIVDTRPVFKYTLGSEKFRDTDGGDAGSLMKKVKYFPAVHFIRSQFCSKPLQDQQTGRTLKVYFITTGLVIAYHNSFDILIYNIQKPSKEIVLPDYSLEFLNKLVMAKKLASKKKPEKTLASLVKTVRLKEDPSSNKGGIQIENQYDIQQMKEYLQRPVRVFKMPYQISAVCYQAFEENFQSLGVGLVDGAIIVIDLILGIEKNFLEKHPAEVSTLCFYDDKVLISGSIDGRVNLNDLEGDGEQNRIYKCQNCQDRKIPVAKVLTSEYGIGIAVDIEGNCRFYDLIRLKKIAKISSSSTRDADARFNNKNRWRLFPTVTMDVGADVFLGVTQIQETPIAQNIKQPDEQQKVNPKYYIESEILIDKKYSDVKEKIKGLRRIDEETLEHLPFYLQKSSLCIFRFEDVIINLFPSLGNLRKKGITTKEIFLKNDPNSNINAQQIQGQAQNNLMNVEKLKQDDFTSSKSNLGKMTLNKNTKSSASGVSNKNSVNFNLGQQQQNNNRESAMGSNQEYDIPTLQRLNPELYKEYIKQQRQMKDPIYQSVQHLKERHGYFEMRVQRIQKRTEEVTKELEAKNEEEMMKTRKKNMRATSKQ